MNLRKLAVIPAIAAALTMSACAAQRPSADDLKEAMHQVLEKQGMSSMLDQQTMDSFTTCMSEKLHASDIEDDVLNKMVEAAKKGEDQIEYKDQAQKNKSEEIVTQVGEQCGQELKDQITENLGGAGADLTP